MSKNIQTCSGGASCTEGQVTGSTSLLVAGVPAQVGVKTIALPFRELGASLMVHWWRHGSPSLLEEIHFRDTVLTSSVTLLAVESRLAVMEMLLTGINNINY